MKQAEKVYKLYHEVKILDNEIMEIEKLASLIIEDGEFDLSITTQKEVEEEKNRYFDLSFLEVYDAVGNGKKLVTGNDPITGKKDKWRTTVHGKTALIILQHLINEKSNIRSRMVAKIEKLIVQ